MVGAPESCGDYPSYGLAMALAVPAQPQDCFRRGKRRKEKQERRQRGRVGGMHFLFFLPLLSSPFVYITFPSLHFPPFRFPFFSRPSLTHRASFTGAWQIGTTLKEYLKRSSMRVHNDRVRLKREACVPHRMQVSTSDSLEGRPDWP